MGLRTKIRHYLSPRAYLRRLVQKRSGMKILAGPFTGMRYIQDSYGAAYLPKLVGVYEREVNEAIQAVIDGDHDLIVDVGAAEGYYAVGLATKCDAPIVGFEMSAKARRMSAELAEMNGVAGRIEMHEECDAESLERVIASSERPFVLIDVEGAEAMIVDKKQAPSLTRATMLIEMHEFCRPGYTAELFRLFEQTHEIQVFWETGRDAQDYPYETFLTRWMPKRFVRRAVEEHRFHGQSWVWLRPRTEAQESAAA